MRKIISLFKRDYEGNRLVYDEVVPGAEWVINGEGVATEKFDGTCCLVKDGRLFKRYDVKKKRKPPTGFIPAQDPDEITGHWPGWVPVGDGPEDKWHREGFEVLRKMRLESGTYELVGPKVQGNPYGLMNHHLWKHGSILPEKEPPRDFSGLQDYFAVNYIEGIVWHRENGDMVKIKRRDFGLKWPITLK